ncbi:lysozyme inhibitor LprI family protein [Beggiatoa leptomitoformis]|uniref:DUF1311 domain-containing protein n=1 Tax=Beggiatoa leptomitoformis TaxID=288004 RepID=A0A2N9YCM0_9GAMM|nr:lysozyme inhibitor LprI family protein [Beggiatoa leptomitoformis]AUI68219.1 DUF1311 domain-containing protein [Beggiatoa leptomitoformis]QGX03435.1 DUF1311 domain-containing protein [Beggiatoa leptomitoformis]
MLKQIILLCFTVFATSLQAASFDCKKARAELEQTICNDADLSALDSQLGDTYKTLLKSASKRETEYLRETQRYWAQTRGNNCDIRNADCLAALYRQRIATLTFYGDQDYANSATGKVSGIYTYGKTMEMMIEALSDTELSVHITGAEPSTARWICDFGGQGTLEEDILKMNALDDVIITVTFHKGKASVNEGADNLFCGAGGTLNGDYQKKASN